LVIINGIYGSIIVLCKTGAPVVALRYKIILCGLLTLQNIDKFFNKALKLLRGIILRNYAIQQINMLIQLRISNKYGSLTRNKFLTKTLK
jgi:hypothetical protein